MDATANDGPPPSGEAGDGLIRRALTRKPTQYSHDVLVVDRRDSETTPQPQLSSSLQQTNLVRNSLLAGSISGMASTIILYPMDLLRTNMQAASMSANRGLAGGPLQVLRQTLEVGGLRALYTGIALPLAAQAVYKGTVFTVNNTLEQIILDYKTKQHQHQKGNQQTQNPELSMRDRLFCGFAAGAFNGALFVTPVEFVRNQLIAQQASRLAAGGASSSSTSAAMNTSWSVIRHAIVVDGVHTLWRGTSITVIRDGLGVACFFSAMATTQSFLMKNSQWLGGSRILIADDGSPSFLTRIISGGMAGLSYWIASLPLDTVKTWVQSADTSTRISPVKAIRTIYAEHGPLGVLSRLNRGWQVAYGRGIPSAAITMAVYSYAFERLQLRDQRSLSSSFSSGTP